MNIREHLKQINTLNDAQEIILVCGPKTHGQLFFCVINTHDIMESTIENYELNVENIRKVIGKVYSRQKRNGTQVLIHDIEVLIQMLEQNDALSLPEDIKIQYSNLLDFDYKGQHYKLESVESLEQNVFRYFDLYGKLNSMYYIGIYRMFEYVINVIDGNMESVPLVEAVDPKKKQKDVRRQEEQIGFKENQLIVLFEGENSLSEMITNYAIKFMRYSEGKLEDLKSINSYRIRKGSSKEKCIYFVKEFYATCRYLQGKYNLNEILIIGEDAKEFIQIIYNVAGSTHLIDLSAFQFISVTTEKWQEQWKELLGIDTLKKLELEDIKYELGILEEKIGLDQNAYRSLYQVSINALLLKLFVLYQQEDTKGFELFLSELR
ncbi:MAG: hypothetical protein U0L26_15115 [Cellulosilyticum sp.]|nr:hypothetical protein [Cellulosilyticum sp.]